MITVESIKEMYSDEPRIVKATCSKPTRRKSDDTRVPREKTICTVRMVIALNPNINREGIMNETGFTGPTVKRSLDVLIKRGVIQAEKTGVIGPYDLKSYTIIKGY